MKDRIKKVLANSLDMRPSDISDDASPETLPKWDSLKHMNIVLNLEEEFGVKFPETRIFEITDIDKIGAAIRELQQP